MAYQLESFRPTWHLAVDSCCLLGEARRGEARQGEVEHQAALTLAECAWVLRSVRSGILGSQTVSPVSRLVWTESPTWCKTKQHKWYLPLESLSVGQQCVLNSHKVQIATYRLAWTDIRSNTGSLCSWFCRVLGAGDGPKRQRGSVSHPDSVPAGPFLPCWSWWCVPCPENQPCKGRRYSPPSLCSACKM